MFHYYDIFFANIAIFFDWGINVTNNKEKYHINETNMKIFETFEYGKGKKATSNDRKIIALVSKMR